MIYELIMRGPLTGAPKQNLRQTPAVPHSRLARRLARAAVCIYALHILL